VHVPPTNEPCSQKLGYPDLLYWVLDPKKLFLHYLCKLLTYGHKICTNRQLQPWFDLVFEVTQVKMQNPILDQMGGTNLNRCIQLYKTLVILHSQTY